MDNMEIPLGQPNVSSQPVVPNNNLQAAGVDQDDRVDHSRDFVKTIVMAVLGLTTLTFLGLFVWVLLQYNAVSDDIDGRIAAAVADAKEEQALELEKEFAEREKYEYRTFSGPVDYGELTFEYPKTWSVYIAADAANGGDFSAYLNPIQVEPVSSKDTINALRVTIQNKDFESIAAEYQKAMEKKDSNLSVETITVGGVVANKYSGQIPNTDFSGFVVIFKIRDKTAILQTDSMLFEVDFDKILATISFNA